MFRIGSGQHVCHTQSKDCCISTLASLWAAWLANFFTCSSVKLRKSKSVVQISSIIGISILSFDRDSADKIVNIIVRRLGSIHIIIWGKEFIIPRHDPRNTKMKEEIKFRGKVAERRGRRMIL
jgi:hypothetical protein